MKKLRVGWFTFTCCEDSSILFIELLNDHYKEWLPLIDFIHAKILKSRNVWQEMDIAIVEGAICSKDQEEKLNKIRGLSKKLIALGACACTGMPSAQRNVFPEPTKEEIKSLLQKFSHSDRVKKLDECVSVDDRIPGCPMNEVQFVQILNKYLIEFKIIEHKS